MTILETREKIQKEISNLVSMLDLVISQTGLPIINDQKSGNKLWVSTRELTLRYQIPINKVNRFFEGLKEGKLLATRCNKCGTIYFPPQADCPKCRVSSLDWIELPTEGEVIAFTKINVKPMSFSHYNDYVVGVVKLTNGVNVLAWINTDSPKVGMKVRLKVYKREPEGYLTYSFEPIS